MIQQAGYRNDTKKRKYMLRWKHYSQHVNIGKQSPRSYFLVLAGSLFTKDQLMNLWHWNRANIQGKGQTWPMFNYTRQRAGSKGHKSRKKKGEVRLLTRLQATFHYSTAHGFPGVSCTFPMTSIMPSSFGGICESMQAFWCNFGKFLKKKKKMLDIEVSGKAQLHKSAADQCEAALKGT